MSYFCVKPDRIDSCIGTLARIGSNIGGIYQEINHINADAFLNGSYVGMVNDTLKKISDDIELQKNSADSLADTLRQISLCYKNTENNIIGETVFSVESPENGGIGSKDGENGAEHFKEVKAESAKDNAVSWKEGSIVFSTTKWGTKTEAELSGELGGASWDHKFTSGVKYKDKKLDSVSLFDASISGEAHVAKGKISGSVGATSASLGGTVGQVKAEGSVGATLFKNGKLAPQLSIKGSLEGAAATGEAKAQVGSDNTNVHASAEGSLLSGKAKGELGIGKVTYKEDDGTVLTGYGVSAEAKAEAYVAQGKVKGGFTIFGIKVDIGLSGKAGGAGASIGAHAVKGSVGGNIGIGVGVGAELEFKIDWTGFKWGW